MKIYRAILLSIGAFALVIFIARSYGLNKVHKKRIHPLLSQIETLSFSEQIETWQNTVSAPHFKIYENTNGHLVYKINNQELLLSDAVDGNEPAYLFSIIKESERVNYLLSQIITNNKIEDKVIISSPYRNVLMNIRNLRPRWLTTISPNELFLSILLSKVFLASLAPLKSEILLLDKNIIDPEWISEIPWQEIKRRDKFVITSEATNIPIKLSRIRLH